MVPMTAAALCAVRVDVNHPVMNDEAASAARKWWTAGSARASPLGSGPRPGPVGRFVSRGRYALIAWRQFG